MNLGKAILCGALTTCSHHAPQVTNANRWPLDPPDRISKEVVLVGDSIAASWRLMGALNHGIGGQRVADADGYLSIDALIYRPRVIVIEGGINDLREARSLDEIIQHRINMLRKARDISAASIFTNLLPVNEAPECSAELGQATNDKISTLNTILKKICEASPGCYFADFNAAFGGKFDYRLYRTGDCIHPNDAGYDIMDRVYNDAMRSISIQVKPW